MGVDFFTANRQAERQTEEWTDVKKLPLLEIARRTRRK